MGACFSVGDDQVQNDKGQKNSKERGEREVTYAQTDAVIMKLKIQKDRMFVRIKALDKQEKELEEKIKNSMKDNNKDQARYYLKQKKLVKENCNNYRNKQSFLEENIMRIENAEEDAAFTDVLKESNQTLKELTKKIDLEEIETAKMLQKDAQAQQAEINQMLNDSLDDEIEEEYARLEAQYLNNNLQSVDNIKVEVGQPEKEQPQAQLA